jgi:MFS family permease
LTDEFGWERGLAAGAFSFGFLLSGAIAPLVGRIMDRYGPRLVLLTGACLMGAGLLLAPLIEVPWHLYLTLGALVSVGVNLMSFTAQSLYLPHWFVRRRAFAIGIAFSGVGVGAVSLLPWLQVIIEQEGWRAACTFMGLVVFAVLLPINLLVRKSPADVGLEPDGVRTPPAANALPAADNETKLAVWTAGSAIRTGRFWWIALGFFCALFAWYAVQVHQTKYLIDQGYDPLIAAWALGLVSIAGVPGQIGLGALSDRIGREWVWTASCAGFVICYAMLLAMEGFPSLPLLYVMVGTQGFLGYAMTSVMGPIVAEGFEGPNYGAIFGALTIALLGGGAAGPWVAGLAFDLTGGYRLAFMLAMGLCAVSALAIWIAGPGRVNPVPGRRRS